MSISDQDIGEWIDAGREALGKGMHGLVKMSLTGLTILQRSDPW